MNYAPALKGVDLVFPAYIAGCFILSYGYGMQQF